MSWTDHHQTEGAADDDQILGEEFDEWVRVGAEPDELDESDAEIPQQTKLTV